MLNWVSASDGLSAVTDDWAAVLDDRAGVMKELTT